MSSPPSRRYASIGAMEVAPLLAPKRLCPRIDRWPRATEVAGDRMRHEKVSTRHHRTMQPRASQNTEPTERVRGMDASECLRTCRPTGLQSRTDPSHTRAAAILMIGLLPTLARGYASRHVLGPRCDESPRALLAFIRLEDTCGGSRGRHYIAWPELILADRLCRLPTPKSWCAE